MNKYTSMPEFRKGVSPWIVAMVIAVIMALIVAVLPTTATSARADESEEIVTNELSISEIAEDSIEFTELSPIEEVATTADITDTTDVAEDPAAEPEASEQEVAPDVEPEPGLLDQLVDELQNNGLIRPFQVQRDPGPVNVDIEFTDIVSVPANQDGNVYVGDRVSISGTWNGQLTTGGAAQTFIGGDTFSIPFPTQVRVIPNDIRLTDATDPASSWGTCTPNLTTNAYDCVVVEEDLPQNQDQPFGGFSATSSAAAEGTFGNGLTILPRQQGDLTLVKSVDHILEGPLLGDEPSGTVFSYLVQVSGTALEGRSEPLVLVDTFDDGLTFNGAFAITAVDSYGTMPVSHTFDSDTNTLVVTLAPEVAFAGDTVSVRYRLVTDSGGLDPVGTEYVNTVAAEGITAEARITQIYENIGSGEGVDRGSFDLTKIVEEVPAGFDRTNYAFNIQVEEYAPGTYPGTPESTYTLDIVDGQVVSGLNPRPVGWTIVLSENLDRSVYNWDEPVFSGNGVTTFVENGRNFASFETVSATNVEITLTNRVSAPQIGTTAQVAGSTDNVLGLDGGTVVDTVAYENLKPGTTYTLEGEIVAVDAAGTVTPTGIIASGEFTTDTPAGQSFVSGTTQVTFTITAAQAAAWADQRLVVYETLYEAGVIAPIVEHRDPNDVDQTFNVAPGEPEIGTLAQVQDANNPKLLPLTGGEVVDTVSYSFLTPETEYRLEGELMHVDGASVTPTGITTSGTFTTPAAPTGQLYVSGTAEVTFTITGDQAAEYGGQNLVVYEELFLVSTGALVAEHTDPTDADQTFRVQQPGIDLGTSAATNGPNAKLLPLTGGEVVDTVSYTNLDPETEYRIDGELMHVDGTTVTPTGIFGTTTFTTPEAAANEFYVSGTALVVFDISAVEAEAFGGQNLVVFEELYLTATGELIAEHVNPNDQLQTFAIERPEVEIGTTATVTEDPAANILPITGGEVIDTVAYTNLDPETEYRLDGELMHVAADGTVTPTGIFGTTTFTTPEAAADEFFVSGTIEVVFDISGDQAFEYGGEKLVVFEELFLVSTGALIAEHTDPNDEDQTFFVEDRTPEIGTRADVTGTDTKVLPVTGGEVIDTVSYTDLRPNTEYRLDGELMHVDGATVTATGILATTTFTTPEAAAGENYVSGTTEVVFTISAADAANYAGEKLVVFEVLFDVETGDEVADHQDPTDEDQSFEIEPGGEIIVEKEVTGPKGDEVENDENAVFQVRAQWTDMQGNEQSRIFNVTPGQPVSLTGLPLDTEITLSEIGADTSVSNVKWGDIIWSGEGVSDESGDSADGTIILRSPGEPVRVGLENKTSSNALIIIPIPIPLIPGGGSSEPPAPTEPVAPLEPAPPVVPDEDVAGAVPTQPGDKVAAQQPQPRGLAVTGADVMWIAGGGLSVLLLGAWLVLRGRRNES